MKSLSQSHWKFFGWIFQENVVPQQLGLFLKLKSLWNHFQNQNGNHLYDEFSRNMSSGSSFAPFLQLKSFWNHFQNDFGNHFWMNFLRKCRLAAVLLHFCNLDHSETTFILASEIIFWMNCLAVHFCNLNHFEITFKITLEITFVTLCQITLKALPWTSTSEINVFGIYLESLWDHFENRKSKKMTFQILAISEWLYTYGSRSKTHIRLLVSEWHLQI